MLTPELFIEQLGLSQTYRRAGRDFPSSIPKVIEFLDEQDALLSGILYTSPEDYAVELLGRRDIKVFPGAILLLSGASDALPELHRHSENLSIIGIREPSGRLCNKLMTLSEAPWERDRSMRFGEVWAEIISNRTLTVSEIQERLYKLPELVEPFVQIAVVVFYPAENSYIPYNRIMYQIKTLLPNCCTTVRDKEIILLITYKERRFDYPFDFGQISAILEKYNGYMSISNGTRQLQSLRELYQVTRRAITLAHDMKIAAPERIFTSERLGVYSAIDLCARAYYEFIGKDGLIYLAHPAAIALARYDRDHNDNLKDVLYFYLINDRSIAHTASALFMHRNTILNKVRKINQLLGLDLEDRHLRQRLLFSCQLIHYFEDIIKGELKL